LLPPDHEIAEAIDYYVDAKLAEKGHSPAPAADDATLLRRTTLDLAGRIPTAAEAQAYVAASDPTKRTLLIDRLLASPAFLRHQINEFDALLATNGKGNLRDYLQLALGENRPWDQIFRELVLADESEPSRKGASQFVKSRVNDLDRLANETSVVFFGVNISCAKCHDHPLVAAWSQEHFYGMTSFFSRTFDNGGLLAERAYGKVEYKTTDGENRTAKLMFLTGTLLDEPDVAEPKDDEKKQEKERLEQFKKDKKPVPPPDFSRRAKLVEVALEPDQRHFFAKALVNQLWNRFYGNGLVMPLDQMHPENKPSHPELLDWLARDFVEHGYDVKRLTRGLVLSKAYARTSRWEDGPRPSASLFAVAEVRPLTPAQYASVLGLGSANPDQLPAELEGEELDNRLRRLESAGRSVMDKLEQPRDGFQVSVDEALLLANSERVIREVLRDSQEGLLFKLKSLPERRAAIEVAIWNTLSRAPAEEEVQLLEAYLHRREERLEEGWKQMVWALLTSSEARFNY
jgi:hypothetical protein